MKEHSLEFLTGLRKKYPNSCLCCGEEFSDSNVYSEAGWRETFISATCELCFDSLFKYDEDDYHR